jgi:ubiquinone/menaquinone biosynthesis C-methylase UbiE
MTVGLRVRPRALPARILLPLSTIRDKFTRMDLGSLRQRISADLESHPHLEAIRGHNYFLVGELAKCTPLAGSVMLDLGASIHRYAREAALATGVHRYEGIDIDVSRHWGEPSVEIQGAGSGVATLRQMQAERLAYDDGEFDCILTTSTFEHFLEPSAVLSEMYRVLKPGGAALVNFEPVWSWAHGAHLQQFGPVMDLVPPWSHLLVTEVGMPQILARQMWPKDAPVSIEETLHWIYHSEQLNRLTIREHKSIFRSSPFTVVWACDLVDALSEEMRVLAQYVSTIIRLSSEEFFCRECSMLLQRPRDSVSDAPPAAAVETQFAANY